MIRAWRYLKQGNNEMERERGRGEMCASQWGQSQGESVVHLQLIHAFSHCVLKVQPGVPPDSETVCVPV